MENFSLSNLLKTCGVTKSGEGLAEVISRIAQPAISNQLMAFEDHAKLLAEITNRLKASPKLSPFKDTHIIYVEETIKRLRAIAKQPSDDDGTLFATPSRSSSEEPIDLSQYEIISNVQRTPITRSDRSPMTNSAELSSGDDYKSPTGSNYRTPRASSYVSSVVSRLERSLMEDSYYSPTTKLLKTPGYF